MGEGLEVRAGFNGGISFFYDNMQIVVLARTVIESNVESNGEICYSWYAVTPEREEGRAYILGYIEGIVLEDSILRKRIAIGLLKHFIRRRKGYDRGQKIEIEPSEIKQERIAA